MNLSNLAAAVVIARYFGISDKTITQATGTFEPLGHRLELIARINGTRWYNDSLATTPESTIAAIEAFSEPKIIIAGGYDKGLPLDNLAERIASSAKAIILIGQTAGTIAQAIKDTAGESQIQIKFADSMAQAVNYANEIAEPADVVLMSPACASYDMFDNYQHRGREFASLVNPLNG